MQKLSREPYREQSLAKNIVFIDGMSGSGKSMIAPVLSSCKRGELWMLDHIFEYSLIMHSLDSMSLNATETLMKIYIDHDSYHLMIGRNINYRETDDSSAQKNGLYERYNERSKKPEGDSVIKKMEEEKPINIFMSHYIFRESKPLFTALNDRLKLFIVPVRHPFWTIENWLNQNWDNKMANNPRDLAMTYQYKGKVYPWHVKDWEDIYDQLHNFERAIETIQRLWMSQEEINKTFSIDQQKKILIIPFEIFAINPSDFINKITKTLETEITTDTESIMRSMNLPREINAEIFSIKKKEILMKADNKKISSHYKDLLVHLADEYEKDYLKEII
tara:strand:- start:11466 stop:12464 length:999 start_codon:yes stop_codon:yes gene_type:complete